MQHFLALQQFIYGMIEFETLKQNIVLAFVTNILNFLL